MFLLVVVYRIIVQVTLVPCFYKVNGDLRMQGQTFTEEGMCCNGLCTLGSCKSPDGSGSHEYQVVQDAFVF